MPRSDSNPHDPMVGARIDGRYTVRGMLGRGGMGVVYDAVHDELERPVAIKVLNAAWASDPTAVARFLREARTASSFTHGNIVDVSDLGRLPDGRPYLVMPKIAGIDLASLLRESGTQPPKRVAELLAGAAAALDLIHAKGLIHRDIKPENLMYVVREDGSETVMLLDFGIAALVASTERITRRGSIFGTPEYLPPEVWDGKLPDRRGDVYALATVAFELMTGVLPFVAENVMQILPMKLKSDAPSMVNASAMSFPTEVEAVIARGLAREPKDRYDSASALVGALRDATARAPVSWRPGVVETKHQTPMRPTALERDSDGSDLEEPLPSRLHSDALVITQPRAGDRSKAAWQTADGFARASNRLPLSPARRWLAYAFVGGCVVILVAWWSLRETSPAYTAQPAPVVAPKQPEERAPSAATPAPAPAVETPPSEPPPHQATAPIVEPIAAVTASVTMPARPTATPKSTRKSVGSRPPSTTPLVIQAPPPAAPTQPAAPPQPATPKPPTQPARDPAQAAQLTREGTSALLNGQVAQATELLRRATQADPGHAPAWRSLGLAFERSRRVHEAIDAYQRSLRIEPRGAQADKVRERVEALQR